MGVGDSVVIDSSKGLPLAQPFKKLGLLFYSVDAVEVFLKEVIPGVFLPFIALAGVLLLLIPAPFVDLRLREACLLANKSDLVLGPFIVFRELVH